MLYEMTTGKLPFDAESPVSVALQQIQSQPKTPRSINPDIPEGLEDIIIRAMQKDPARRYQSAAEMLRDIDEFKRDPTVSFEYKYTEPEEMSITENFAKTAKKTKKIKDEQVRSAPVVPVLTGITVAFIIVAILFLIGIMAMVRPFEEVPDTTAPNLIGMDITEAKKQYPGFDIEVESSAFHDSYDKDVIYYQNVKPGMTVKEKSTIKVKISSGVQTFSLADYTNFEENQVYAILTDNDIEFTTVTDYSDDIPEGYVIRTEPGVDTVVDSGTVVIIYVSLGPKTTYATVPNVLGYKLNDAKLMLNSAGIKIGSVTRVDSTQAGTVILDQSLAAGTQVQKGTTIDLVIAMERDSEDNSVTLDIPLPEENREVQVEAFINGSPAAAETVNPYMISSWTVTLTGEGISTVSIYYDDRFYRAYSVDFTDCTYMLVSDSSSDFGG